MLIRWDLDCDTFLEKNIFWLKLMADKDYALLFVQVANNICIDKIEAPKAA